ncbi:hypothetical protein ElyMa_006895200 [Elysia marginata]|uniref:Uncharacterized protein n=1 Tax=Elysia marginata TaxID=1093978 RepID=A0AAV4JBU8_9GAST|nr:hypothetical protein ElyMa_006895200 [Elysia marginata]
MCKTTSGLYIAMLQITDKSISSFTSKRNLKSRSTTESVTRHNRSNPGFVGPNPAACLVQPDPATSRPPPAMAARSQWGHCCGVRGGTRGYGRPRYGGAVKV